MIVSTLAPSGDATVIKPLAAVSHEGFPTRQNLVDAGAHEIIEFVSVWGPRIIALIDPLAHIKDNTVTRACWFSKNLEHNWRSFDQDGPPSPMAS